MALTCLGTGVAFALTAPLSALVEGWAPGSAPPPDADFLTRVQAI